MYLFFRLLSLISLLLLITGFILKIGGWYDSNLLFRIGVIGVVIAWAGRMFLDRRMKAKARR